MDEVTIASVTAWSFEVSPNHRGRVPVMPKAERTMLAILEGRRDRDLTEDERALRDALKRKLVFRASREIDGV
jgi:hypothetical protein